MSRTDIASTNIIEPVQYISNTAAMSELKYQKLVQVIERLKKEEELPRVKVSQASQSLIGFIKSTGDPLTQPQAFPDNPLIKKPSSGGCNILWMQLFWVFFDGTAMGFLSPV